MTNNQAHAFLQRTVVAAGPRIVPTNSIFVVSLGGREDTSLLRKQDRKKTFGIRVCRPKTSLKFCNRLLTVSTFSMSVPPLKAFSCMDPVFQKIQQRCRSALQANHFILKYNFILKQKRPDCESLGTVHTSCRLPRTTFIQCRGD